MKGHVPRRFSVVGDLLESGDPRGREEVAFAVDCARGDLRASAAILCVTDRQLRRWLEVYALWDLVDAARARRAEK